MKRILLPISLAVLPLGAFVLPVFAQQDNPDAVIADCSGQVSQEKVDSCLERTRVIDETNPSAQLQSLEAQLKLRAEHPNEPQNGSLPGSGSDPGSPSPQDHRMQPYEQPSVDQNNPSGAIAPDDGAPGLPPENAPSQDDTNTQGTNR